MWSDDTAVTAKSEARSFRECKATRHTVRVLTSMTIDLAQRRSQYHQQRVFGPSDQGYRRPDTEGYSGLVSRVTSRTPVADLINRVNNAGIAGEGSREGYEAVDMKDPDAIAAQLWKSETSEWDAVSRSWTQADFVKWLIQYYTVRFCGPMSLRSTSRLQPFCHCWPRARTCSKDMPVR